MSEQNEKRMVSDTGYEVQQAFRINGKEILLAENQNAENCQFYLVCSYREYGIICEYSQAETSGDYIEAVQSYAERISKEAEAVQAEFDAMGLPSDLFSAAHCYPHNYAKSIEGKVIAIRADVFSPEYRHGSNQLVLVVNGNGVRANPSGHAVYCYHLNDGTHTRFERFQVLGIVRPEALPNWAKESLVRLQSEMGKTTGEKEYAGNYEIIERIEVGQKVFVMGFREKTANPFGTWQGYKNSRGNFDWGHYFDTREDAKADLHDRAAKEQLRLDSPKRSDKGDR